jgi:hypothetical protein
MPLKAVDLPVLELCCAQELEAEERSELKLCALWRFTLTVFLL